MHGRARERNGWEPQEAEAANSAGDRMTTTTPTRDGYGDLVEYHYKLALKLRKNFPLAALNLGAYQYEMLNQLAEAEGSFKLCAFEMSPRETRTFRRHVQIQIECLISGAKLHLDSRYQHQNMGSGSKTSIHDYDAASAAAADEPSKQQQTNYDGPTAKQTTTLDNVDCTNKVAPKTTTTESNGKCLKVVEWMQLAKGMAKQIESTADSSFSTTEFEWQFGDLNKQLATIHWILAQCEATTTTSSAAAEHDDEQQGMGNLLAEAVGFALKSQVSMEAIVYTSYADFISVTQDHRDDDAKQVNSTTRTIKFLGQAIEVETKRKLRPNKVELAKLHHKLARVLLQPQHTTNPGEHRIEAMKQMDSAIRLAPNDYELVSFGAQVAYEAREFYLSEQLYSRALEIMSPKSSCQTRGIESENKNQRFTSASSIRDRKLASARANYGAILQVNGRLVEAEHQYRRALDCDPMNSVARTNLRRLTQRLESTRS